MCNPALLAVGAAAVTATGQIQAGIYQSQMSRYQAQVAEQNKQLTRENAADAIVQGQDQQRQLGREVSARVGAQTARMSGNNVDITSGSAARVIDDTRMIGREDSDALNENIRRKVKGLQVDAWNFESRKRASKAEGKQALVAAGFSAASTLLGGATQYAKFTSGGA
ncbi:MAG TPA: hypothetical protein VN047_05640 [Sphingopyxis sp.]|uniref:hypothetical protein n=1 Tax=Sphingopyxis sp. TaxID=1908224 RepID=UPI002B783FA2|nr:hypothetical protein [Sphingopyxis sp.]HWW56356.1 hypothetical protein [Sphingopyxis sp.]